MGIKSGTGNFFQSTKASGSKARPAGYAFPVGLNQLSVANTSVDYLIVAGGGGGGGQIGSDYYGSSGGGAGGLIVASNVTLPASTPYSITVGGGGPVSQKGFNSSFPIAPSTALGGGSGIPHSLGYPSGQNGGSGGGSGDPVGTGGIGAGTGTPGQGNNGGNSQGQGSGGGGGGAGGAGSGVNAGAGLAYPFSGSPVTYAAGGQGGPFTPGVGGGAGTPNTGDGGQGKSAPNGPAQLGGAGGSGIVIIRYSGSQSAGGGNYSSGGGYSIHTFTGDGTFATNSNFGGATTYNIN